MNRTVSAAVEHESAHLGRAADAPGASRSGGVAGAGVAVRVAPLVLAIAPFLSVAAAAVLASGDDGLGAPALGVLFTSLAAVGSAHRIVSGGAASSAAVRRAAPSGSRAPW